MTAKSRKRLPWLIAVTILVLGVSLRLPGMIGWWINPDEGAYFSMVTWDEWGQFWREVAAHAHPPLYYIVLRLVGLLTVEFVWLRAVALVSGSIAIWLAWLVGRELGGGGTKGDLTGLGAALVVAVSPGAILMSQIIRPYAFQLGLQLAAFLALLVYLRSERSRYLVSYSLWLSLSQLTHYSSFFILATLGSLVGACWLTGSLRRDQIRPMVLAHAIPVGIAVGFYLFHLRPHLLEGGLAPPSFEGWLRFFLIDSMADVWFTTLGFFGYLLGPRLAAPGLILFVIGLVAAIWRRSWPLAITSLTALAIGILAAAAGKYPLGACRQSSWLIGFLIFPLAWAVATALASRRELAVGAAMSLLALGLAGPWLGRLLGGEHSVMEPMSEQLIWRADLESVEGIIATGSEPAVMLLSHQTYYVLVPLFEAERESRVYYPEGRFFRFRWGQREIIVSRAWRFAVHPDKLDQSDHLYNVIGAVDRVLPELELSAQRRVLMPFGGWMESAPIALEKANLQLPPTEPLSRTVAEIRRFRVHEVDLARFWDWFGAYLASPDARSSP